MNTPEKTVDLQHSMPASAYAKPDKIPYALTVPDDCTEMITLFTVHGALIYVDPMGVTLGYDDVFTRIEKYRAHFEGVGLGADYVKRFMR